LLALRSRYLPHRRIPPHYHTSAAHNRLQQTRPANRLTHPLSLTGGGHAVAYLTAGFPVHVEFVHPPRYSQSGDLPMQRLWHRGTGRGLPQSGAATGVATARAQHGNRDRSLCRVLGRLRKREKRERAVNPRCTFQNGPGTSTVTTACHTATQHHGPTLTYLTALPKQTGDIMKYFFVPPVRAALSPLPLRSWTGVDHIAKSHSDYVPYRPITHMYVHVRWRNNQ